MPILSAGARRNPVPAVQRSDPAPREHAAGTWKALRAPDFRAGSDTRLAMADEALAGRLRRAYDAFNAGGPSVWLELYDPDIVLRVAPDASVEPGAFLGPEAVEGWFTELFRPFGKSFHVEVLEMI